MTTSTFKFSWIGNSKKVSKKDLPVNELDKQPGYIEQNKISQLISDFKKSPLYDKLKKTVEGDEYKKSRKGKPQRFDQAPKLEKVKVRDLFTALAVQRKIDWDHLIKIVVNWDSRRPMTVNVIRIPNTTTYYITDGQHTVLAYAVRAMLGLFPDIDPNDFLDIEINCQVVETNDFSFAREHFLGINGDDKLPILPWDRHKIEVFGARLDNSSQEQYLMADRRQSMFEKHNLIPVHPESVDRFKPGAVIDVNLIKKLDVEDIKFIGENHSTYWPQEPVDAMEMLPLQDLRKRLLKEGADFNKAEFKQFMDDLNGLVKEIAGGFPEFKNLTQQVYPEYYFKAFGEKPTGCPRDASLVLLMQLYQKAGGKYQYVPKSLTSRYCENGKTMFQCLSKEKRELFK